MKVRFQQILSYKSTFIISQLILTLIIIAAGYFYYISESKTVRREKNTEIEVIGKMKINQLAQWHKERYINAVVNSQSPFFITAIHRFLSDGNDTKLAEQINERLLIMRAYGYESLSISSVSGEPVLISGKNDVHYGQFLVKKIREAIKAKHIIFTDFYHCTQHDKIHYDIVAPIEYQNEVIAALVFHINPDEFLYPFIQSWPATSKSYETLLLRRDGDSIVYLSNLRYQKNAALHFKKSINLDELPASKAVLGFKGLFEGKDYRGADVLSYLGVVPGTNWYIVTKVDKSELFEELYSSLIMTIIFGGLLILLTAVGTAFLYNYQQRNIYKKLWQTQEQFRTTLYSIGDAVIVTDKNGRITTLNPVAEKLTGYHEEESKGRSLEEIFKIISEDTRECVENPVQKVLREGLVIGLANHTLLISKNGLEIPIADSGAPIKNEHGETEGVVLIFRDQTEERMQQNLLKESEARLNEAQHIAQVGNWQLDIVNNKLFWSEEIYRIFELNQSDFSASYDAFLNLIHPDDRELVNTAYTESIKTKIPYSIDHRLVMKDGRIKYVHEQCHTEYNEKGEPIFSKGTVQDITLRKLSEEALRESEERFRLLISCVKEYSIVILNTEGYIETWNEGVMRLNGYTEEEIISKHYSCCFAEEDELNNNAEHMLEIARTKGSVEQEMWELRKDGSAFWGNVLITSIRDSNGVLKGFAKLTRDMTERKMIEEKTRNINEELELKVMQRTAELDKLNQEMEAFSYSVSHDLRAPLWHISGFIGLLKQSMLNQLDEKQSRFIDIISNAALKMGKLIDDLLSFSKLGKAEIKKERISIDNIVAECLKSFDDEISSRSIELELEILPEIFGDKDLIKIVFTNLISNAVKYTGKTRNPKIKIGSTINKDSVEFFIRDNGAGFEMSCAKNLFKVFKRLHTQEEFEGTGVGLANVKRIVERHGGSIHAEGEVDKGACFYFSFPINTTQST